MTKNKKEKDNFSTLLFDSRRIVIEDAYYFLNLNPEKLTEVLNLCKEPSPVSMRAARVVQLYFEHHIDEIPKHINFIFEELINTRISGVKRGFLKVILSTPKITEYHNSLKIFDICQKWILSSNETIAVRAYSLDVIFKFAFELPELKNELELIFDSILFQDNNSLKLKYKKLLRKAF